MTNRGYGKKESSVKGTGEMTVELRVAFESMI